MSNFPAPIECDDPGLVFFLQHGARGLIFDLVVQSVEDIARERRGVCVSDDAREPQSSAGWLSSETGHKCLSFVMPDASPREAVARIFADPQAVINALAKRPSLPPAHGASEGPSEATVDLGVLEQAQAACSPTFG